MWSVMHDLVCQNLHEKKSSRLTIIWGWGYGMFMEKIHLCAYNFVMFAFKKMDLDGFGNQGRQVSKSIVLRRKDESCEPLYGPPGRLLWSDHRRGSCCSSEGHQVGPVRPHRQRRAPCGVSQPRDCEWPVHRWQEENRPDLHLPREELWTGEVKPFRG